MKTLIFTFFFSSLFVLLSLTLYANEKSNSELIVEADNSIQFYEKEKYYLASGNAIASKDGITLKANTIRAFFDKKKFAKKWQICNLPHVSVQGLIIFIFCVGVIK